MSVQALSQLIQPVKLNLQEEEWWKCNKPYKQTKFQFLLTFYCLMLSLACHLSISNSHFNFNARLNTDGCLNNGLLWKTLTNIIYFTCNTNTTTSRSLRWQCMIEYNHKEVIMKVDKHHHRDKSHTSILQTSLCNIPNCVQERHIS